MRYYNTDDSWMFIILVWIFTLCIGLIMAFAFQFLWNWIVPLFWATAPILTYWQSCGTLMLISIVANIFKSFKK